MSEKKLITLDNLTTFYNLEKARVNTILNDYCKTEDESLTNNAVILGAADKKVKASSLTYNNQMLSGDLRTIRGQDILVLQSGTANQVYKGSVSASNLFTIQGDFTCYCYQDPDNSTNEICFIYPSADLTDIGSLTWSCTGAYNQVAVYKIAAGKLYCVDGSTADITTWTKI